MGVKLITPRVPNFIMIEMPGVDYHHGLHNPKVSLRELSDDQLDQIADNWRLDLFKRRDEMSKNDG